MKRSSSITLDKPLLTTLHILTQTVCGTETTTEYFGPIKTTLIGTVETQTFPGPPNYESIASGDEIESCWYLKLQHPINVLIASGQEHLGNDTETYNIKVVQMATGYSEHDKGLIKKKKPVKVTGTLFRRLTGHHHAKILIHVEKIESTE